MGIGAVDGAAVFLDRDGVLNELVLNPATGRMESPLRPEDVRVAEGAIEALIQLQNAGYPLILVSNQPNYALGKSSLEMLEAIHERLAEQLAEAGVRLARVCYCLHHPKGVVAGYGGDCECRKPSAWFLLRAAEEMGLSLRESWMVGDLPTDIECGRAAGVRTIRVGAEGIAGEDTSSLPDFTVRTTGEIAGIILRESRRLSEA